MSYEADALEAVNERPGLRLVERRNVHLDAAHGIQCATYLFKKIGYIGFDISRDIPLMCKGCEEVMHPREGDLAIYVAGEGMLREQAHIGQITAQDRVISKWGYGHVYEHLIEMVPDSYGTEVLFFRRK